MVARSPPALHGCPTHITLGDGSLQLSLHYIAAPHTSPYIMVACSSPCITLLPHVLPHPTVRSSQVQRAVPPVHEAKTWGRRLPCSRIVATCTVAQLLAVRLPGAHYAAHQLLRGARAGQGV